VLIPSLPWLEVETLLVAPVVWPEAGVILVRALVVLTMATLEFPPDLTKENLELG